MPSQLAPTVDGVDGAEACELHPASASAPSIDPDDHRPTPYLAERSASKRLERRKYRRDRNAGEKKMM